MFETIKFWGTRIQQVIGRWASIAPLWLVLPGQRQKWSHVYVLEKANSSLSQLKSGERYDLVLGDGFFLVKRLSVPRGSMRKVDEIVALHMRRTTPNNAANLIWRHRVSDKFADGVTIQILAIKETMLNELVTQITGLGALVRTVQSKEAPEAGLFYDKRKLIDKAPRFWGALSAASLILSVFALYQVESRQTSMLISELSRLKGNVADRTAEMVAIREQAEELQQKASETRQDYQTIMVERTRLRSLVELSSVLTDETWISSATFDADTVYLSVFTVRDVPDVIKILKDQLWVDAVEINGPILFDTLARQSRFDVTLKLAKQFTDQI